MPESTRVPMAWVLPVPVGLISATLTPAWVEAGGVMVGVVDIFDPKDWGWRGESGGKSPRRGKRVGLVAVSRLCRACKVDRG